MSDDPGDSVTRWLYELREEDTTAATRLWDRYFEQLIGVARRHLHPTVRPIRDAEDVAASVFTSLCEGVAQRRLDGVADREALWKLLVVITKQKAIDYNRHEFREKRGSGKLVHLFDVAEDDSLATTVLAHK